MTRKEELQQQMKEATQANEAARQELLAIIAAEGKAIRAEAERKQKEEMERLAPGRVVANARLAEIKDSVSAQMKEAADLCRENKLEFTMEFRTGQSMSQHITFDRSGSFDHWEESNYEDDWNSSSDNC